MTHSLSELISALRSMRKSVLENRLDSYSCFPNCRWHVDVSNRDKPRRRDSPGSTMSITRWTSSKSSYNEDSVCMTDIIFVQSFLVQKVNVHLFSSSLSRFNKCLDTSHNLSLRLNRTYSMSGVLVSFFELCVLRENGSFGFGRAPSAPQKAFKGKKVFFGEMNATTYNKSSRAGKNAMRSENICDRPVAFVNAWKDKACSTCSTYHLLFDACILRWESGGTWAPGRLRDQLRLGPQSF